MTTEWSTLSSQIAASLLEIGAVTLSPDKPYTWSSGMLSPIYCDNRLTLSYPEIRNRIAEGFASLIREHYPDAEVIAGTATGAIAHGAWVAEKLNLPMVYIRSKAKGYGQQRMVEGVLKPGQKVVVIEDLISTGGSSLKAAKAVQDEGGDVQAVLAIFTYELSQAGQQFADSGITVRTLSTYSALLDTAVQLNKIDEQARALLQSWKENPAAYEQSVKSEMG
ncbi:orotate phosphoribosyltransferase [Paenibacillus senegalensis]|uniref:orotate phosphoribosyltransferase n=1 Tax=Paenibacillus senegalensis TaxID=1465766 RepID=UPI0002894ED6|nr:orotate phosphoribosyltransferase [Paenibacillus senegalensis]